MNSNEHQQTHTKATSSTNHADDEHFRLSESLISWMEHYKTKYEDNPDETLSSILPQPSQNQKLYFTSPHVIALNLVRNFGRRQNCDNLPASLDTSSYILELNQRLDELAISKKTASNESQPPPPPADAGDETARSQFSVGDDEIQAIVDEFTLVQNAQLDTIESTVINEDKVRQLFSDKVRLDVVIESLLGWLSSSRNYSTLARFYYAANLLLKTLLDTRSTRDQVDLYSSILVNVCLAHPQSVEIFSPYLSPSTCSAQCFLDLYKTICSRQVQLGPMATFVMLSKFDIKSWLASNSTEMKKGYHELVVATCSAFKDIGRNPDRSYELTMDLLRRHLQAELASPNQSMPDELLLVLGQFLNLMDEQTLAPDLWFDFLTILGLQSQNHVNGEGDFNHQDELHEAATPVHCTQSQVSEQIWSSFLFWLARITQVLGSNRSSGHLMISGNASKLITAWLRMLVMLEHQLGRLMLSDTPTGAAEPTDLGAHYHRTSSPTEYHAASDQENLVSSGEHDFDHHNQPGRDLKGSSSYNNLVAKAAEASRATTTHTVSNLSNNHRCLLELVKQLISLYDSINSGGLWSYLKSSSNKSEQLVKVSITSLSIAYFLASRALDCLVEANSIGSSSPRKAIVRDELAKLRRVSLVKLRAARKSRSFADCVQFIDTLIVSVQQNSKVQYGEVVQLITGFSLIESGQHHQEDHPS